MQETVDSGHKAVKPVHGLQRFAQMQGKLCQQDSKAKRNHGALTLFTMQLRVMLIVEVNIVEVSKGGGLSFHRIELFQFQQ